MTADDDRWCFIDGLTQKFKILLDLMAPLLIVTFCATLFIFSKFVFRKRLRIKSKKVNFEAAGLAVFLFIVGKVVDTLFKLISCQSVGGSNTVHLYFAYESCYGATWIVAVLILLAIIIVFGVVFVFGRKLTADERADPNTFMFQLCHRFKARYWYWEYAIFVRRITISFFAVGISSTSAKLVFLFFMVLFTCAQWQIEPFSSREANQVFVDVHYYVET